MPIEDALAELESRIGEELKVSDWLTISQEQVNLFADATLDHQWIHVDPERATRESPFGGPVAHGFMTLSLVPHLRGLVDPSKAAFEGVKNVVNYGLNKARFMAPVPVGARIRGHFTLKSIERKGDALVLTEVFTAEVERQEKPACVAETIMLLYF